MIDTHVCEIASHIQLKYMVHPHSQQKQLVIGILNSKLSPLIKVIKLSS